MDGRIKLANKMIESGNHKAAGQVLRQALRSNPTDPEALYLYATARYRSGDLAGAEEAFRKLLVASPRNARAHYGLGVTLAHQGRRTEARQAMAAALAIDAAFTRARQWLAELDQGVSGGEQVSRRRRPTDEERLQPGRLLHRDHRRLSSYLGRFVLAVGLAAVGLALAMSHEPGRFRGLADGPPIQWPSIDFLQDRYAATGQEEHRQELVAARAHVRDFSDAFDVIYLVLAIGLVVAAGVMTAHAVVASSTTHYAVYERRIDVTKGVLFRRRFDAWLFRITDTEFRQTPLLALSRNAEIRVYQEARERRASRFRDPNVLKIIGYGTLRQQERFFEELRVAALSERRALKNYFA